jgi:hypothetical protein
LASESGTCLMQTMIFKAFLLILSITESFMEQ